MMVQTSSAWPKITGIIRVLLLQLAPAIPGVQWTTTAAQRGSADATGILQDTPATSVPWASMDTPAAHVSNTFLLSATPGRRV